MAKNELSPEMRVLLACGLSLLILLISRPLLVHTPPPGQATPPPAGAKAPSSQKPAAPAAPSPVAALPNPSIPTQPLQGQAEEEVTVVGNLYRVVFSTRGAGVKSWTLKDYHDDQGHPLDLVDPAAAARYGNPLGFWTTDENVNQQVNSALFVPSVHGTVKAPVAVEFTYNGGGVAARKKFVFSPDSYVVGVESDLISNGKPLDNELAWRGTFGDINDIGARGTRWEAFYRNPDKITLITPRGAQGAAHAVDGVFAFAGLEDRFFCAAFLPPGSPEPRSSSSSSSSSSVALASMRLNAFKDPIFLPGAKSPSDSIGVAVGDDAPSNSFRMFVGPKDTGTLRAAEPLMPELINYGWFGFISRPLLVALRWMHFHVMTNYGWDIVLFTIVVNMAMFPLKVSSLRSARKMQQLQPQLKAIQEKYKQFKKLDPKRQQMSQETMELYKKHGVNPIGGCLPMLLQLPFLYGFYEVLIQAIEMRQANWISWWVPDLSAPEAHFIKVLPLLMCASQFVLQRMTPTPTADPAQQKMMMFMPVLFLGIFYYFSSGLVLYYLTSNAVGIGQQWYINRTDWKHRVEERRTAVERKKRTAKT